MKMDWDNTTQTGARASGVKRANRLHGGTRLVLASPTQLREKMLAPVRTSGGGKLYGYETSVSEKEGAAG